MGARRAGRAFVRAAAVSSLPLVAGLAVLAACADAPGASRPDPAAGPTAGPPPLVGTAWQLQSLGGAVVRDSTAGVVFTGRGAEASTTGAYAPDGPFAGWALLQGDVGCGLFDEPYRLRVDSLLAAAR